jgi:hypothetical protein
MMVGKRPRPSLCGHDRHRLAEVLRHDHHLRSSGPGRRRERERVEYKSGSTAGSTVSVSNTFKHEVEISASLKAGVATIGGKFSAMPTWAG